MDYEKKYKEAQGWIEKIYPTLQHEQQMEAEAFFPELAESEDEKIRKAIINVFSTHKDYEMFFGASVEDIRTWLEKQGEQKASYTTIAETGNGGINTLVTGEVSANDYEEKPADEVEPKFKVKYAGSEYNVFETKDIAGVTFYGIEDEPNHIDYVKAENCEIISVYAIKENGSPYPTKPAVFSEKKPKRMISAEAKEAMYAKPAWSEEDEVKINRIVACLENLNVADNDILLKDVDWLKSLKPQNRWKPSDEQIEILDMVLKNESMDDNMARILRELREQLKKLTE